MNQEHTKLKIISKVVGPVSTNCYFLVNTNTQETVIVDPGDCAERLIALAAEQALKPVAILLTHGHFDHILAAAALRETFGISIYAGAAEQELLENGEDNLSGSFGRPACLQADCYVTDLQMLELAGFRIQVIFTPGHTGGSVCYYLAEEKTLISGDTLFYESVGRTDFPTGSMAQMTDSLRTRLLVLPEDTRVYPGHGGDTDIGHEIKYNPFA